MRSFWHILRLLVSAAPGAMARGAALTLAVLMMGAALLGLSGWFITATGVAGIAGIGIAFDVFRPSAGVRLLALGRAAARYGERVLTHDATLRALAALRVDLLRRISVLDARALMRLRGETALTRIVSDVDALDGVLLRLFLPVVAALVTHVLVFLALGGLVGWTVAVPLLAIYLAGGAAILRRLARRTLAPSADEETCLQDLRRGTIDMIRDREALILAGQLHRREDGLITLDAQARALAGVLDRAERRAGLGLSLVVALAIAAAVVAGGWLVTHGTVSPAVAAIGVFVALALSETLLPLRRGFAELGRMAGAARRVDLPKVTNTASGTAQAERANAVVLSLRDRAIALDLRAGQGAALTGPSGAGKTRLLLRIARLLPTEGARIEILGSEVEAWPEPGFRAAVAMVPQRSALMAGTLRDNLALSGDAGEAAMWAALDAVDLARTVRDRGGLDLRLGEGGEGFSGGQARRVALARAILRRPALLLLDEPAEGLDCATADRVLNGLRDALPETAILAAIHRGADHVIFAERVDMYR